MPGPTKEELSDAMNQAIENAGPLMKQLSFGTVVGYCSGAAAKKVGKALAVVIGMGFVTLQTMVHTGYVTVDWKKVEADAIAKIDTTGDGKLSIDDIHVYWGKVRKILTNEIPSAGGFSLGFLYALSS
jgi:uncharacterized membrane protein (Fun14 family)